MPTLAKPAKKAPKPTVSNQVTLDANNPIPFEYGGVAFSYLNGQRYIPFLQPGDDFFKTLLESKTLSTTHNACVETKKSYCAGRGLYDRNGKEFSKEFEAWRKRVNAKNESAHTINRKIFGSHFTFGNTPIELVRFKVGSKPFLYVYVHNVLEWRLAWPDKNGNVTQAIHSKLFLRQGVITGDLLKDARTLPLYDSSLPNSKKNWKAFDDGTERTMIWLKNDYEGYDHYGMPSAIASLIYQVNEYKGARYNLDNFENNMVVGGLVALKGNLSQTEADRIGKKIISTHTGDGRRGRVAVVASEEGIGGSEFHQYQTQAEGSYIQYDDRIMAKIIMANEWDGLLAGIAPSNSLGKGNTFLRTIYDIKKNTVIEPLQNFVLENVWMNIQYILKQWTGIDSDQYDLGIIDIDPISIIADVDPTPAIRVNEVRKALDLPEDLTDKGNMYLGELAAKQKGGTNVPA
jgi:hypothetical protein